MLTRKTRVVSVYDVLIPPPPQKKKIQSKYIEMTLLLTQNTVSFLFYVSIVAVMLLSLTSDKGHILYFRRCTSKQDYNDIFSVQ